MGDDSMYADFDASVGEVKLQFRMCGKDYTLSDPPAAPFLNAMREGVDLQADSARAVELMAAVLGNDNLDQMLADGMSMPKLNALIEWVMRQHGAESPGEGDSKNSPRPLLASSSTGES